MTSVVIEQLDGREVVRIADVANIPRVGEFLEVLGDMLIVRSVIWDLSDGPLTNARLIVESDP